ncbi:MAG: hypothetical protein N5P05_003585 [Chroococcopsis gigantea SAG 12.99]|nr:hypothetical protein [Chroococcopsis gigantea SAG 12.99]
MWSRFFASAELKFYEDIDVCLQDRKPNLILLSGVIQCLENPYELIHKLLDKKFKYIVFDRTAFTKDEKLEILMLQKVHPNIYQASYPAWFLNKNKFLSYFQNKYDLMAEFDSQDRVNVESNYKGFIFKRRENAK